MATYGSSTYSASTYGTGSNEGCIYGISFYGASTYGAGSPPSGGTYGTYGSNTYGSNTYGNPDTETPPPGGGSAPPTYDFGKYDISAYDLGPTPPPPPPVEPPVIPTFDIYTPPRVWRFVLADSATLTNIAELPAKGRSLQLALNKPGSASFTLPISSPFAPYVQNISTCLKAYRNGILIWSGPVWNVVENLPDNSMNVSCVGWFEILNHRLLRQEKIYSGSAYTAGQIALNLLSTANSQKDGAISVANPEGNGTIRPTGLIPGVTTDAQIRNRTYQKWSNIGQSITELTEIENGFDLEVTPDTKTMNVYAGSTPGVGLRRVRDNVQFGYNWGPNNLRSFSRQIDSSTIVTQVHAMGGLGTMATASASSPPGGSPMDAYGLWEEQHNLSDVNDNNVLQAYASGEVGIRSTPRIIYTMLPFPYSGTTRVPEPFVDYRIGDQIRFTAKFAQRIQIEKQAVRVYGITVNIDEEGNENISSLELSPS